MLNTARLGRVVVKVPTGYQIGTCYAITSDLVLTANHTLKDHESTTAIQVRFLSIDNGWEPAEIAWCSPDLDAAVLRLPQKRIYSEPLKWGYQGANEALPWDGAGFPSAGTVTQADATELRESVDVRGKVGPHGGHVQGVLELTVEGAPHDALFWQGLSGGPVFVRGQLVGLIRSTPRRFGGARLWAIPTQRLLRDRSFAALLGPEAPKQFDKDKSKPRSRILYTCSIIRNMVGMSFISVIWLMLGVMPFVIAMLEIIKFNKGIESPIPLAFWMKQGALLILSAIFWLIGKGVVSNRFTSKLLAALILCAVGSIAMYGSLEAEEIIQGSRDPSQMTALNLRSMLISWSILSFLPGFAIIIEMLTNGEEEL